MGRLQWSKTLPSHPHFIACWPSLPHSFSMVEAAGNDTEVEPPLRSRSNPDAAFGGTKVSFITGVTPWVTDCPKNTLSGLYRSLLSLANLCAEFRIFFLSLFYRCLSHFLKHVFRLAGIASADKNNSQLNPCIIGHVALRDPPIDEQAVFVHHDCSGLMRKIKI